MTTVCITLEDNSMLSALRSILMRLNGIGKVIVLKNTIEVPNKKTLAAINELNFGKGTRCKSVDELFEKLNS